MAAIRVAIGLSTPALNLGSLLLSPCKHGKQPSRARRWVALWSGARVRKCRRF